MGVHICRALRQPSVYVALVTATRIEESQPVICSGHPSCRNTPAHTPLYSNAIPDYSSRFDSPKVSHGVNERRGLE